MALATIDGISGAQTRARKPISSAVRVDDTTGGGPSGAQQRPRTSSKTPAPTTSKSSGSGSTTRSSGGGGSTSSGTSGGGGSTSTAPTQTSSAVREAERRAREAEEARRKQLEDMRTAISEQPLDPSIVAAFAERERLASRGVDEAEVFAQRARTQSELDFNQFVRQLGSQTDQAVGGLRQEAAARNLAFQPHFVGRGLRDIRDQSTEAQTQAQDQRAQFLAGIERQINQAQQAKEAEMAAIEREQARAQADHQSFIDAQLAALRG